MSARTCAVDDCSRPMHGLGYCKMHYNRVRSYGTPNPQAFRRSAPSRPSIERFMQRVDQTEGCWLWTGSQVTDGYGSFRADGYYTAHRWAYAHFVGDIPEGMFVCHHCDTPACVRPDHLFLGTPRDNTRDMWDKGRDDGAPRRNRLKTRCANGHEFTPENTYVTKRGRACRACTAAHQRRYQERKKARSQGVAA